MPPQRGLAPYYNVLDPRVQEAMLDVVRELVARYAQHPSFAGLAMQLSADGYAQLPGPDWGMDDATIARFERDDEAASARATGRSDLPSGRRSSATSRNAAPGSSGGRSNWPSSTAAPTTSWPRSGPAAASIWPGPA